MRAQALSEEILDACIGEFVDHWTYAVQYANSADELRALLQHVKHLWILETGAEAKDEESDSAAHTAESPIIQTHAARTNDASGQQQAARFAEVSSVSRIQANEDSRIRWQKLKMAQARIGHLTSSQRFASATDAAWTSLCRCGGFKLLAECMLTGEYIFYFLV